MLQLTPDSVACTANCRSALEKYAENFLNATDAQTFREALMSGCEDVSSTNGSSCTQPDSDLLTCLDLYRQIGPNDDIAKNRICSDCRSGLEDYADRCLPTSDRESFKDQLSIQCGDKSNPCSIDSDRQACFNRFQKLSSGEFDSDNSFCTDCRSDLEQYADNCLDKTFAQSANANLTAVCRNASGKSNPCSIDSDRQACLNRFQKLSSSEFDSDNSFCTDCRSDLERYADNCLDKTFAQSANANLTAVCRNASGKSNPCSIDSDRQACLNRFQKLSSSEFDSDNSFCTDCRSDLERYADNCLDKTFAQSANANLTAVCRNASGKSNPCSIDSDRQACLNRFQKLSSSEFDSDNSFCTDCRSDLERYADNCLDKTFAQSANANLTAVCRNASGDANIIGPTLLSTISALLLVFLTVAFN